MALFEQIGKDDFFSSLLMAVGRIMREVIITETDSPSPVRVTPPWVIIVIRIWMVIIFRPEIDLLAQEDGISVIHLAERFDLFSLNFTCYGDLFPSPVDI